MANRIDYAVVNDWGSGLQASISLIPDHQLNGWTLEFDAAYDITQIWNARIVSHVGTHYVIRNLDWNAAVPSGGSVSFGFLAGPGPAPAGYALDGQAIGTTPAPPAELPAASVADISVTEGNSGESLANFIVTLAKASSIPVTLNFTTRDGTARAGSDYVAASGTVTFAPGETSKVIKVAVLGDTVVEASESFSLILSGASGATLSKASATATITNDDTAPVVLPAAAIADVSVAEGDSGQKLASFTVTLSKAATGPVSLAYATQDGSAKSGSDYVAASGTIVFAAGETTRTIAVAIPGDTTIEADENFTLALTAATGATIARGVATATIRNDDVAPVPPATGAMVGYAVASDWGSGFTANVAVTASTTKLDGWTVEFDAGFTITNLWNAELVSHAGTHYVIRNAGWNGSVAASATTSFGFQAATPGGHDVTHLTLNGATPGLPALPTLSIADATVTEGNGGSIDEVFALTLSQAATTAVTVRFDTVGGTATAGSDFTAASGTITFNPGETSKAVRIGVLGDAAHEATEAFTVRLSAAAGATIARDTATGTILDNDAVVPPPATGHAGFYHTQGNQIVDDAGQAVTIAGVNWFGFETGTFAPHGLHARSYTDMMDQMKSLGFNTIRLPFSDQLFDAGHNAPSGIDYNRNPGLQGLSGLALMDAVVDYAGQIGLKIILDHHRSSAGDGPNGSGLWYDANYGEAKWIGNWQMLAQHYAGNPTIIGADLANEPHGAASWGDGGANDWAAAATRAGNAIQSVNPDWLMIVEGTGQTYWWGGDLSGVAAHPITLGVANHVVYSPHDYPNSIYGQPWFSAADFPNNLEQVFDAHWGYIYRQGIAPVLLGEFGSRLADPKDVAWLDKLTHYLDGDFNADGRSDIADGQQGMSWSWWSWNPDSGDTGGILKDDWTTVNQAQLAALQAIMADNSPLSGG